MKDGRLVLTDLYTLGALELGISAQGLCDFIDIPPDTTMGRQGRLTRRLEAANIVDALVRAIDQGLLTPNRIEDIFPERLRKRRDAVRARLQEDPLTDEHIIEYLVSALQKYPGAVPRNWGSETPPAVVASLARHIGLDRLQPSDFGMVMAAAVRLGQITVGMLQTRPAGRAVIWLHDGSKLSMVGEWSGTVIKGTATTPDGKTTEIEVALE